MTRDELILSCEDIVKNLVRKYNNHKSDEDLQAVGMTAVIECVDRSIDEGLTDVDQVQARCNRWARNSILDEIYKEKIKYTDDNSPLEHIEAEEALWETIACVKNELTPRNIEVFDLLLQGHKKDEIKEKLNISDITYYHHLTKIKEKIKNLPGSREGV